MRKLLIILLFIPILCQGQFDMLPISNNTSPSSARVRGVWGISGSPASLNNYINTWGKLGNGASWYGVHLIIQWDDIETSDNVFTWTQVDNMITIVKNQNLLVGVQLWVGPNTPSWLMTLAGTFTTSNATLNVLPRYYNPVYTTRYHRMLRKTIEHLASVGGITEFQISEGSTGDVNPYHGTLTSGVGDPFVPQTSIDDDQWTAYRIRAWDSVLVDMGLFNTAGIHLLFNTGNNARTVDLVASPRYAGSWCKKSDASHEYVFNSEGLYSQRPYILSRSEADDSMFVDPHWGKNYYMQVVAGVSQNLRLDIYNTYQQYYTAYAGTDTRFNAFFNKYANDTAASTSRKAFIKLGLTISIDSTTYWDEATYGPLITPANMNAYNNAINTVNSNPADSPSYKAYRRMEVTRNFTNPARITNLETLTGTTAINGITNNPRIYSYNNDFLWSGTQNWAKFITENNPKANSFPLYRLTPDTSIYGRFAKQFTGTNLMSFDIDENWDYGAAFATVNFSIVYRNSGTGSWAVQVYNSAGTLTTVTTQTNTNTGQWLNKTFSATMFFRAGEDFRVIRTAGTNFPIDIIELDASTPSPVLADGSFQFTLPNNLRTSAGVYRSNGTLVRTLWADSTLNSGTYTGYWDGKDDYGGAIPSPDATYTVKVLSNNVQYNWDGIIGNTSANQTGLGIHKSVFDCMTGIAITGTTAYFCQGYSEGNPSEAKFSTTNPQVRVELPIYAGLNRVISMNSNYVVTDGINVYWAGFDGTNHDVSFVHATKVSDGTTTTFSSGASVTVTNGVTYPSSIDRLNTANSYPSGLAVGATYLFIAHGGLNQLHVLNKTTGALAQNLSFTNPRALAIDGSSLWMATSTSTVAKYTINADGTLSAATVTLSGITTPMASAVSGGVIGVIDAGTNQIVRFFNTTTGAATTTLGTAGGYNGSPNVTNTKFMFTDLLGNEGFITFNSADGSFWLGDPGNYRVQHFTSANTYIDNIMSMAASYSSCVDPNNISRVFGNYLEFSINYAQPLSGTTGWTLVRNWGYGRQGNTGLDKLRNVVTLSNGRTYAFDHRNSDNMPIMVELTATGIRNCTDPVGWDYVLCKDGSLQLNSGGVNLGGNVTLRNYALTGFLGNGDPQWSATGTLLATTPTITLTHPNFYQETEVVSSNNKVIFYNRWSWYNGNSNQPYTGYHLGAINKGGTQWLWETQRGDQIYYAGTFPGNAFYELGNGVNQYSGSLMSVVDNHVISGYHGEFWKNTQTNYYNHYLDDGLSVGQFGTDGVRSGEIFGYGAGAGFAGNALTPQAVRRNTSSDTIYLYHGDESVHAGLHKWRITNLSSISEQSITIPFPSAYVPPTLPYTDLHAGLAFNSTPTIAGWSVAGGAPLTSVTGTKVIIGTASPDVFTQLDANAGTWAVAKNLGTLNVGTFWTIAGDITYFNSVPSGTIAYSEVLDATGKTLIRFYYTQQGNGLVTIRANTAVVATNVLLTDLWQPHDFSVTINNGNVTVSFWNFPPVNTTIFDGTANWRTPRTLQQRLVGSGPNGGVSIGFAHMKLYND